MRQRPAPEPPAAAPPKIHTVSEINAAIHELLEASFGELWVEGEVSNCRAYPSGHVYLTLKDEGSQIAAVLFKGYASALKFRPEDGLKVLARARVSSYVKRGDVQLILTYVEPREKGALQLAFEQLKKRLAAEGLFDEARKKPLPAYPRRVGIVTSLQGAALQDMLRILKSRWPGLAIAIIPVRVQGDGAAAEIAAAIRDFNELACETEVLLVGRGGGSIEDLWAFNEEAVARAIAASRIPVVSCVGHETDFTIADFVADRRASTPSNAAELVVPEKEAVLETLAGLAERMSLVARERLARLENRLQAARGHKLLQSPERLYEALAQRLDDLYRRSQDAALRALEQAERGLGLALSRLEAFSPLKVLSRGYAIAEKLPGREILRSAAQARPGDNLILRLHQGSLICEVAHDQDN